MRIDDQQETVVCVMIPKNTPIISAKTSHTYPLCGRYPDIPFQISPQSSVGRKLTFSKGSTIADLSLNNSLYERKNTERYVENIVYSSIRSLNRENIAIKTTHSSDDRIEWKDWIQIDEYLRCGQRYDEQQGRTWFKFNYWVRCSENLRFVLLWFSVRGYGWGRIFFDYSQNLFSGFEHTRKTSKFDQIEGDHRTMSVKIAYTQLLSACIHAARESTRIIRSVVLDSSNVVEKNTSALWDGKLPTDKQWSGRNLLFSP